MNGVPLQSKVTHTVLAYGVGHNTALRHGIEMDAEITMEPPFPPPSGAHEKVDGSGSSYRDFW